MPLSVDQALAFADVIISSPKVKVSAEAALGYGRLPKVSDFSSSSVDALERAEEFLWWLKENVGVLEASIKDRPRQGEIFDEDGKSKASGE